MPRRHIHNLVVTALTLVACAAFAQTVSSPPQVTPTYSFSMGFSADAYLGRPLTGAPYSAQEVSEHTQTLADGTHITQPPRTTQHYRDSAGRTRTERPVGPDTAQFTVVEIMDPVAGYRYVLDPTNQVAHRTVLKSFPTRVAPGVTTIQAPPPPPTTGTLATSGAINFVGSSPGASPPRSETTRESLGSQVMQGVPAEGHRITQLIPVGAQGNDQPMTIVNETWYSPTLRLMLLRKTSDPRSGVFTVHFENLVVGDPDPALFLPPPNYQVVDEAGSFQMRFSGTRP